MNITVNAEVNCVDGFYGHLICIILNPTTDEVTHVAVRKDGLFSREWLVPVSHIVASTPERIQLDLSKRDLETRIPPFIKTEFLEADLPDTLYTTDLMWPHLISNLEMRTLEHENIPLHELAVHSGATVNARDGVIGRLEDFIIDPDDKHVTQIVIRAGHWHAHSRVAIPVSAIDHFDEYTIYLALDKQEVEALTTV
jgi:uncharacterized protein YrrD